MWLELRHEFNRVNVRPSRCDKSKREQVVGARAYYWFHNLTGLFDNIWNSISSSGGCCGDALQWRWHCVWHRSTGAIDSQIPRRLERRMEINRFQGNSQILQINGEFGWNATLILVWWIRGLEDIFFHVAVSVMTCLGFPFIFFTEYCR